MSKPKVIKPSAVKLILLVGVLLLAGSAVGWWRLIYSDPDVVFDRMLSSSLSTTSISKTVKQSDQTQNLRQATVIDTQPKQIVRSLSILEQDEDGNTKVVTENIGTPDADYVRYVDILTNQKNSQGQQYDFSQVKGVWGKTTQESLGGEVQQFNQAVLGVVPFANLELSARQKLLTQLKQDKVYDYNKSSVKRQITNGRPTYSYSVTINPVEYVKFLKSFASAIGVTQLDQVDPSQYKDSAPLSFTFEIDVWSGQLTKVIYAGSDRTEIISGYGARNQIAEPDNSIGIEELQSKLQQIQ